jgi:peptide-methionine (S)-S-oxide reductase
VCSDKTSHVEVCQVSFDEKVKYEDLLTAFWNSHDPTQQNRQGPDVGIQYRSVIFYHSKEQKALAEKSKKAMEAKLGKVATTIEAAKEFWKAEEYHQNYLKKKGKTYC